MSSIADMDIDLLRALDALLLEQNVTRAAEHLGISQPALSARLTRLRTLLDDRLFIPSPNGRGVLPTPRASALAPLVTSVLGQIATMLEPSSFESRNSSRVFTLALPESPAVMLGPELVRGIQSVAPNVRIRFVTPDKARLGAMLENAEVDICIGIRCETGKALISRALFEDEFVSAQRKGHPRGSGPIALSEFCALPHVLVSSSGDPFSGTIDAALNELGLSRRVALSLQSYAVAPTIVAGSDLICTLPALVFKSFAASIDLFEPPIELAPAQFIAYWHPRQQEDLAHRWFRGQLFAAASEARANRKPS